VITLVSGWHLLMAFGKQLDPDWYEISVPAGAGQLSLSLTSDSSVGNVDLTLSKKDGPKVFESLDGGNLETIIWMIPFQAHMP
jgi:hypothetical protein